MPLFLDQPAYTLRLGQRISTLRQEKGLTQAKLAEAAGMDPATLSRAEIGSLRLSVKRLLAIAGALETDVADLFPSSMAEPQGSVPDELPVDLRRAWRAVPADRREMALRLLRELGR